MGQLGQFYFVSQLCTLMYDIICVVVKKSSFCSIKIFFDMWRSQPKSAFGVVAG